jgi:DNA polymerase V
MNSVFALVDCNNFFVSCERIFRPDLEGRPVVVLSSNDGCAVARSNEAKALGIPMGAPAFKYRDVFERHAVVKFSANFDLYGDISRRIITILTTVTPRIEVYSVDESFLDLSELAITDYAAWGVMVREKIMQWVGVPVSVGIAPTKTLAKLASDRAKKDPLLGGVLDLATASPEARKAYLQTFPIEDIWGIGWRLSPRLRAIGIATAAQLADLRARQAQQLMGIQGRQLIEELKGVSCHPLDQEGKAPKSIAATRTFGEDTHDLHSIEAAIATFTTQATFKLRRSDQLTRRASLFLATDRHKPGYRYWSQEVRFQTPTADTGQILSALVAALRELYLPSIAYHRAGVMLYEYAPAGVLQVDLLGGVNVEQHQAAARRMAAVDIINRRFGKRRIRFATEDLGSAWKPRYQLRSPRYTTDWQELAQCRIIARH